MLDKIKSTLLQVGTIIAISFGLLCFVITYNMVFIPEDFLTNEFLIIGMPLCTVIVSAISIYQSSKTIIIR